MAQLSGLDATFLHLETPRAPLHIAGLGIYDQSSAPQGLVTLKGILANIESRLHLARCFRQKLAFVPFGLDHPYWVEDADFDLEVRRGGLDLSFTIDKREGEPLGIEVSSAVFDRVRTCDNHCEFCFIYQLPKGMRRSIYLKDDDYRL